ncbi:MAG: COX15/CtaA family protein [Chitinophagales bacterium]|nr:COX15/CtaA family protein [Chitinophagales bacterium]
MKAVRIWLWIGIIMTLIQVILGGITRLTGSGLSITEWDVIMGAIPPINISQWNEAFEKYKQFPQYNLVNQHMDLQGFKNIFWWEYLHRNWARLIGIVFLLPFIYFLVKKKLQPPLIRKLIIVFLLGAVQGLVGWIMVASGLKDKPWVSPYNLTIHLLLALFTYCYLLWIVFTLRNNKVEADHPVANRGIKWIIGLVLVQIIFGGFMAGTKAGLTYPTYPLMDGKIFPSNFFVFDSFLANVFENQAAINFIHRSLGAIVTIAVMMYSFRNMKFSAQQVHKGIYFLLSIVCLQFILGILTLLGARSGSIPIVSGVAHQFGAFLLMGACLYILFYSRRRQFTT